MSRRPALRDHTARRTVLRTAWAAPAVVVTTAAPAVAASRLASRLRFTNVTMTEGKEAGTLYANTRVQVVDGPEPVRGLALTACLSGRGCDVWTWEEVAGWGSTGQVRMEWGGLPAGRYTLTVTASAEGCEAITGTVTVEPPGWW